MEKYTGWVNEFLDQYAPSYKSAKVAKSKAKQPVTDEDKAYSQFLDDIFVLANDSIKFKLPDDAKLFEIPQGLLIQDSLKDYVGQTLHLPFPKVALEFMVEFADGVRVPYIVFAEEQGQNIRIFIAFKTPSSTQWSMYRGLTTLMDVDDYSTDIKFTAPFAHIEDELAKDEELRQRVFTTVEIGISALAQFLCALACGNVNISDDDVKPSAVKQTMRKNKNKIPFYSYKVLTIKVGDNPTDVVKLKADSETVSHGGNGEKGTKRSHLRRGHIRKYQSGLKIWVNACAVGSKKKGVVDKSYELK